MLQRLSGLANRETLIPFLAFGIFTSLKYGKRMKSKKTDSSETIGYLVMMIE